VIRFLDLYSLNLDKMGKVKMVFPDNTTMAEFVIREQVKNAEVDSREQELTALLPDNKIISAEMMYGAILKKMTPRN
jgi:hypothetical protein